MRVGMDYNRATIEFRLARLHRAAVDAKLAADFSGDEGLYLDLEMIEREVTRLAENSLRGKARGRIKREPQVGRPDPKRA